MKTIQERIMIPTKGHLGIERRHMPQVLTKDLPHFYDWLKSQGIKVKSETRNPKELKPSQKHFNMDKVQGMLSGKHPITDKSILVSKDNYVIDGHHQWAVRINNGTRIKTMKIDMNARELIDLINDKYPRVMNRNIKEMVHKNILNLYKTKS